MTKRYTKMMQNSNISSFYTLFALQVLCRQSRHCKRHFSQRWLEPSSRTSVGKVSTWSPLLDCSHVPNCFLAWSEAVHVQFFSVQHLSSWKDPCQWSSSSTRLLVSPVSIRLICVSVETQVSAGTGGPRGIAIGSPAKVGGADPTGGGAITE